MDGKIKALMLISLLKAVKAVSIAQENKKLRLILMHVSMDGCGHSQLLIQPLLPGHYASDAA